MILEKFKTIFFKFCIFIEKLSFQAGYCIAGQCPPNPMTQCGWAKLVSPGLRKAGSGQQWRKRNWSGYTHPAHDSTGDIMTKGFVPGHGLFQNIYNK